MNDLGSRFEHLHSGGCLVRVHQAAALAEGIFGVVIEVVHDGLALTLGLTVERTAAGLELGALRQQELDALWSAAQDLFAARLIERPTERFAAAWVRETVLPVLAEKLYG